MRKLLRGAIDIGVFGGPVEEPELKFVPIGAMRLAWVGAPALLGAHLRVRPADFVTLPIISLPREARLCALMQEWFTEGAIAPASVSYCNNLATMLHIARAALCICIVPEVLAAADIEAGTLLAPAPVPSLPPLKLFIATRAESADPAIAEIASIMVDLTRLPPLSRASSRRARPTWRNHRGAWRRSAARRIRNRIACPGWSSDSDAFASSTCRAIFPDRSRPRSSRTSAHRY